MPIKDFVRVSLKEFSIVEFTEVYRTDEDGRKIKSVGFFRDENIAKAFAQCQVDASYYKTEKTFILTNGKVGFRLMDDPITILDDEQAALRIRKRALDKLSPEERAILKV